MKPLYRALAGALIALRNCQNSKNTEWEGRHHDRIEKLTKDFMPSGSGINSGTDFDFAVSKPERLVFTTSFHHMNDGGSYDGWTDHTVIVTPSLWNDFDLRITGRNRKDIKDYLHDVFREALRQEVEEFPE